jgi:hypothetical protein
MPWISSPSTRASSSRNSGSPSSPSYGIRHLPIIPTTKFRKCVAPRILFRGLQKYIKDWGLATQDELKAIDKGSKAKVEKALEAAKASPKPDANGFWANIYYRGVEPPFIRGREKEEESYPSPPFSEF